MVQFTTPDPGTARAFYRVILPDANATAVFVAPTFAANGNLLLTLNRSYVGSFGGLNTLEVEALTLSASAGVGGVNVSDDSELEIAGAAVSVDRVNEQGRERSGG